MYISQSRRIPASPEHVWRYLTDLDKMADWNPRITRADPTTKGGPRRGFRFVVHLVGDARTTTVAVQATIFQPARFLRLRFQPVTKHGVSAGKVLRVVDYRLRRSWRSTTVTQRTTLDLPSVGVVSRLVRWLVRKVGEAESRTALRKLETVMIADSSGAD